MGQISQLTCIGQGSFQENNSMCPGVSWAAIVLSDAVQDGHIPIADADLVPSSGMTGTGSVVRMSNVAPSGMGTANNQGFVSDVVSTTSATDDVELLD